MTDYNSENTSSRQILKSTSIMGGSSIITIFMRMVRTKVFAVLLGPVGIGLIGIFESITTLVSSVAGMGIGSSGVRQIAEAAGTDDNIRISRTIMVLRRAALISGFVGLCSLLLLSGYISRITFGNADHARDVAMLSITILFAAVAGGQVALIQGMRRIRDLAMLSILGSLLGTLLSIPIIYFYREKGIVLFLIIVSATNILTAWWYSRKIRVLPIAVNWQGSVAELKPLVRLGFVFMTSALMTAGALYLLRVFVVRYLGLEAAGVYQAAAAMSMLYAGFIFDAMGKDFYPRLTAISQDNQASNVLVNKQMEIGLLLAVPGILATMALAPFVIKIFYSSKFLQATEVLSWQILGILLRTLAWPMGFILLAKGNGKLFFWTELFANGVLLGFAWIGISQFGLVGAGAAFFGMYFLYDILMFYLVTKHYEFKLLKNTIQIGSMAILTTAIVFLIPYVLPERAAFFLNVGITAIFALYSANALYIIVGPEIISAYFQKIKTRIGIIVKT